MKTWTTPSVEIDVPDGADALAAASEVVVAARGRRGVVEKAGSVSGTSVSCSYTQAETAALGAGVVEFEVTIALPGGSVLKTDTVCAPIEEAVLRREVGRAPSED